MNENHNNHDADYDNEDYEYENPLEKYRNGDGEIDPRIEFEESDTLLTHLLTSDSDMQEKITDIVSTRMFGYNPLKGK